jgi:hypothetical protein
MLRGRQAGEIPVVGRQMKFGTLVILT